MPIFGAILGAMLAVWTLGPAHFWWGAVVGSLAGFGYDFHLRLRKTEDSLFSELSQLRARVKELELKVRDAGAQEPPAAAGVAPLAAQKKPDDPKPVERQPEAAKKPQSWQESRSWASPALPVAEPAGPGYFSRIVTYFATGNTIAKVGVVLLFFGVSFLLKYVSEQGLLPIELRLTGAAGGAVVLLALGWKLRGRQGPFGLLLQGGGIGIFYLTVFAAFRLYQLVPASLAFVLLVFAVALSSCLAVLQDSRALAVFSVSGGFLAPVLASTGEGSHVMLFSYYAVLNLGILGMAWFRSWRDLNLVGFAFTFVIGSVWGARYYRPDFFASTEPFLVFFFLLYLTVTLLFAGRKRTPDALVMDGTLVFGVPIAAFALQGGLVKDTTYGLAWSAVALGAFYLGVARAVLHRMGDQLRLLVEAFFAIGVCFLTLAVPLALDGKWTAAVWALEGAAVLWSGVRQNRFLARCAGMALQLLAGIAFVYAEGRPSVLLPVFNAFFMGTFVLALSHFLVGLCLHRAEASRVRPMEKRVAPVFLGLAVLWWVAGGIVELNQAVPSWYQWVTKAAWGGGGATQSIMIHSHALFLGLSSLLFFALSGKLGWEAVATPRVALMPAVALLALFLLGTGTHPFANIGALSWCAVFAIHYRTLWASEVRRGARFSALQHYSAFWLFSFLATLEAYWAAGRFIEGASIWAAVALAVTPGLLAFFVIRAKAESAWPLGPHRARYLGAAILPHLIWAVLWLAFLNFTHSGDPRFLPYVPVVNPIDLTQLFVLMVLGYWYLEAGKVRLAGLPDLRDFAVLVGAATFVWLTAALTRTLHHWAGLPWDFGALFASSLVQAALSVFWSIVALALMILATRRDWRVLWISGASLLAIVVVKLFVIDLSGHGTLERIVSFIGTGVLLLLIGYLAPIPPQAGRPAAEARS